MSKCHQVQMRRVARCRTILMMQPLTKTTACGRTLRSPQSEERSSERLGGGVPHEASDLPGVGGRTGTVSSLSPTHKGSTCYHIRLSIGRSGLCPSDRRLRCVGPLTRSFLRGGCRSCVRCVKARRVTMIRVALCRDARILSSRRAFVVERQGKY